MKAQIIISGTDHTDMLFSMFNNFEQMKRQPFGGYLLTYESAKVAHDDMSNAWALLKQEYPDDCNAENAFGYVLRNAGSRIYFMAFHNAIAKINKQINK